MTDFEKAAPTWDEQPGRVAVANQIGAAILRETKLHPAMDVLEFDCGTGLITLQLQPLVHSITGIDSSDGMLSVLAAKVAAASLTNVHLQKMDVIQGENLRGAYSMVVSSMTIHHIPEILPLFRQFFRILLPGGSLVIADLDPDDGQFHEDNQGVHHQGFDRAELRALMEAAGFVGIRETLAAEVTRPAAGGGAMRPFTIFLMTAIKPE